jgi:hypothetical protein
MRHSGARFVQRKRYRVMGFILRQHTGSLVLSDRVQRHLSGLEGTSGRSAMLHRILAGEVGGKVASLDS